MEPEWVGVMYWKQMVTMSLHQSPMRTLLLKAVIRTTFSAVEGCDQNYFLCCWGLWSELPSLLLKALIRTFICKEGSKSTQSKVSMTTDHKGPKRLRQFSLCSDGSWCWWQLMILLRSIFFFFFETTWQGCRICLLSQYSLLLTSPGSFSTCDGSQVIKTTSTRHSYKII